MFIHLSINGQLSCFYLLPIVINAAMNISVQITVLDPISILLSIYL
jgi:hypothetical protein